MKLWISEHVFGRWYIYGSLAMTRPGDFLIVVFQDLKRVRLTSGCPSVHSVVALRSNNSSAYEQTVRESLGAACGILNDVVQMQRLGRYVRMARYGHGKPQLVQWIDYDLFHEKCWRNLWYLTISYPVGVFFE